MGNVTIDSLLIAAFVMTFGLHENMILDRPLIVRCDLSIDADDLPLIFRLAAGKQTPEDFPDGVQGMLQIKSFIPLDANVAMDARRWKIWQQAKMQNHLLDWASPVGKERYWPHRLSYGRDRSSAHIPLSYPQWSDRYLRFISQRNRCSPPTQWTTGTSEFHVNESCWVRKLQ